MTGLLFRRRATTRGCVLLAVAVLGAGVEEGSAQPVRHATGQEVVPAYKGWDRNPDGSFNVVFGTSDLLRLTSRLPKWISFQVRHSPSSVSAVVTRAP